MDGTRGANCHVAARNAEGPSVRCRRRCRRRPSRPRGSAAGCCSARARRSGWSGRSRHARRRQRRDRRQPRRLRRSPLPPGIPASPGAAAGCPPTLDRRTADRGARAEPSRCPRRCVPARRAARAPGPATSLGRRASAAARRSPDPAGFILRSMPMAASVSSKSSGAVAASAAADPSVSLSGFMISVLPPSVGRGRCPVPLGARHKAGAGRGSAGTGHPRSHASRQVRRDARGSTDGRGRDPAGVADLVADVAAAVPAQAVSTDVFRAIVREIPQLEEDKPLLACSLRASTATWTCACRSCSTGSTCRRCRPRPRRSSTRDGWLSAARR